MKNKRNRNDYHNYKRQRKTREAKETRADVLEALEQQRKHAAESHQSSEQFSQPKQIPGFFFDQEKQRYFPLSMKRDSVYVGTNFSVENRTNHFPVPVFVIPMRRIMVVQ